MDAEQNYDLEPSLALLPNVCTLCQDTHHAEGEEDDDGDDGDHGDDDEDEEEKEADDYDLLSHVCTFCQDIHQNSFKALHDFKMLNDSSLIGG